MRRRVVRRWVAWKGKGDMPRWRIGVDAGGTFTDVCLFEEESGAIRVTKVSSTPADPSRAIAAGVAAILAEAGEGEVAYFAHGTTVATNTLIQGRGAATGLITTAGFRDILEIGRQRRPDLYDLQADKPEPLVRRDRRLEVAERVLHDGTVERALDEGEVRAAVRRLRAIGVRAVAVCFLYSYLYPQHEQIVGRMLREEFPEAYASISHEVLPEFREYERLSTTVINGYLGPVMASYLANLRPQLARIGVKVAPHITQSNGGIISFEAAERHPVRTVLSGPSSGVVGALAVARLAGMADLITFDMGGTSTDVSLVARGEPRLTGEKEVEGYPVKTPMIDIHAVGAGGGSIAWIDSGGHLKVGPQSAGAEPGPVCYGLGNEEPTVTDANVVLGALPQAHLLGGRMAIDATAAWGAIERLARRLGLEPLATAQGIVSVVTATMARAIRVISVQRGHDPRDFTLVAFGGAGPLHAARLARELDIPRVIVPEAPGILCALGLLVTDLRTDFSLTRLLRLVPGSLDAINGAFAELAGRAEAWFEAEGIGAGRRQVRRSVDLRYQGQNYELAVAASEGVLDKEALAELAAGFARAHEQLYGYDQPGEPIQAVTFRVEASGVTPKAELRASPAGGMEASGARVGSRAVYLPEAGGFVECPVYERSLLASGNRLVGPALIDQLDATTLILPGQRAAVDGYRNVVIGVTSNE